MPVWPAPTCPAALQVFADVFDLLPRDPSRVPSSRQSALTHDGDAEFTLLENDFTFGGQKIAGNAQAISAKRWLQHTSFLWDYQKERMQLLQEPAKRPKYRGERKHGSFLTPLVALGYRRDEFVEGIEDSMASRGFTLQPAGAVPHTLPDLSNGMQQLHVQQIVVRRARTACVHRVCALSHCQLADAMNVRAPERIAIDRHSLIGPAQYRGACADLDDVLPLLEEPHLRTTKLLDYADLLTPS